MDQRQNPSLAPKIFISHSAKSEPAATIVSELYSRLTADEFDVLLDRARLAEDAGRPWRDSLNTWMELCQGAVILVDEGALQSGWVHQEAAILNWRRERESQFVLIALLVPPITPDRLLELGFSAANIASLQAIRAHCGAANQEQAGADAPAAIPEPDHIDILLQRFAGLKVGRRALTSIERIEDLLVSVLRTQDLELLVQAAFTLGEDLGRWSPNVTPARALARLLLRAGLMEAIPALRQLPLKGDQFEWVCRRLATAWISCRAVDPIARITQGPERQRAVAINSDQPMISSWYLLRASGLATEWRQIEVILDVGEEDPEATVVQVRESLLRGGPAGIPADIFINQFRTAHACRGGPIFLMFKAPEPDLEILERLREEFPAFTFMLLTGPYVPPLDQELSLRGAYFLRPELRADAVNEALEAWSHAYFQLVASGAGR